MADMEVNQSLNERCARYEEERRKFYAVNRHTGDNNGDGPSLEERLQAVETVTTIHFGSFLVVAAAGVICMVMTRCQKN